MCYYDDSGAYVSDYKSTSQGYLKRKVGFVFDVVCSLPYSMLVLHPMYSKELSTFLSVIVYARMAHLPRLITLLVFMWKEEESITSKYVLQKFISELLLDSNKFKRCLLFTSVLFGCTEITFK